MDMSSFHACLLVSMDHRDFFKMFEPTCSLYFYFMLYALRDSSLSGEECSKHDVCIDILDI